MINNNGAVESILSWRFYKRIEMKTAVTWFTASVVGVLIREMDLPKTEPTPKIESFNDIL